VSLLGLLLVQPTRYCELPDARVLRGCLTGMIAPDRFSPIRHGDYGIVRVEDKLSALD
jgi:hypothetical protein